MGYIAIKEAEGKWGASMRAAACHVAAGRIEGAVKKGNLRPLPTAADKPADLRFWDNKSGTMNETHRGGAKTIWQS